MRRIIVAATVMSVFGAAAAYREMTRPPAVRQTTDLTAFGRRAGTGGPVETATFAAGCFWKIEHAMRGVDGVVSTTAGYTGGTTPEVSHATVSTGATGHAEAVRVVYDPRRVSYEKLLDVFWASHDPTRFAVDDGEPPPPGRSIIFFHSLAQRRSAESSLHSLDLSRRFAHPLPTQVLPATTFHRAEPDQQQYLEKHGRPVCGT